MNVNDEIQRQVQPVHDDNHNPQIVREDIPIPIPHAAASHHLAREEYKKQLGVKQLHANHPALEQLILYGDAEDASYQALLKNTFLKNLFILGDRVNPESLLQFLQISPALKEFGVLVAVGSMAGRCLHALEQRNSLEKLYISMTDVRVRELVFYLSTPGGSKLKHLFIDLFDSLQDEVELWQLGLALTKHKSLKSLRIYWSGCNRRDWLPTDGSLLGHMNLEIGHPSLQWLHLSSPRKSDCNALRLILKSHFCPFNHISISLENISDGYDEVLDGLESNESVDTLEFKIRPFTEASALRFQRLFKAQDCPIKSFSLRNVQSISELTTPNLTGGRHILNMWCSILQGSSLMTLKWHGDDFHAFNESEFQSLCQSLVINESLRHMNLGSFGSSRLNKIFHSLDQRPASAGLQSLRIECLGKCADEPCPFKAVCHHLERTVEARSRARLDLQQGAAKKPRLSLAFGCLRDLSLNLCLPVSGLATLLTAVSHNSILQVLDLRSHLDIDMTRELILHLPNIRFLHRLKISLCDISGGSFPADDLLRAFSRNLSLVSIVIEGQVCPIANDERSFRSNLKSICDRNRSRVLSRLPLPIWTTALFHVWDGRNTQHIYHFLVNPGSIQICQAQTSPW